MTPVMLETLRARQTVFCLSRVDPISAGSAQPAKRVRQVWDGNLYHIVTLTKLTSRKLEGKGPDESQDSLGPCNRLVVCPNIENTNEDEFDGHRCHTDDVNSPTAKVTALMLTSFA